MQIAMKMLFQPIYDTADNLSDTADDDQFLCEELTKADTMIK